MKIAVASDHGGFELKEFIKETLKSLGHNVEDFGCPDLKSCDYPDFGKKAAKAVASGKAERGVIVCTTGIGMCMTANKVKGVRAALCHDPWGARMSRNHNDANVLVLGAAFVGKKLTEEILNVWLSEKFEGGRHQKRVDKIREIEEEC
jgi:ribose 5-phosphate isomerase B